MDLLKQLKEHKESICIVGLGYVGLPLANAFAEKFKVIGFDINDNRIKELKNFNDSTNEVSHEDLKKSSANLILTDKKEDIKKAKIIIITVPTPVDGHKNPDLSSIKTATLTVGENLQKDTVVVYESTVYPGVTREICIPILEKGSGLKYGEDFHVGYSPERINPGDKEHTIKKIKKIVAGDNKETLDLLTALYGEIIKGGIHRSSSIEVAEAAKVIENTQRDLNIALINELAIIFNKLNIDTKEVLEAAGTKWNFLKFQPGLVGGHCIGVDPYYLTFKAEEAGYHPEVILAGRRINDNMGKYIADETVKLLIKAGHKIKGTKVLVMGMTFKENIPDIRNSRVIDVINELKESGIKVFVVDPYADKMEVKKEYNIEISDYKELKDFDAIIAAVGHDKFINMKIKDLDALYINKLKKVLIDVKGIFKRQEFIDNGYLYWRL